MSETPPPETSSDKTTGEVPGQRPLRLKFVAIVGLMITLLFAGAVVFFGFFDGLTLLAGLTKPPLVAGTGQIMYRGEPLANAQVTTRPVKGDFQGAVGFCDGQGRFKLQTDMEGWYVEGAYAGEHVVIVAAYGPQASPLSPPPLVTPKKYASFETSPLKMNVSRSPEENSYVWTLEGEPDSSPERGLGGPGGGPGGGRPPSADEMVARTFEQFDANTDDQLSADEIEKIGERRREGIRQADTNNDGAVDRAELKAGVEAFLSGPRPGGPRPGGPRPERPAEQREEQP